MKSYKLVFSKTFAAQIKKFHNSSRIVIFKYIKKHLENIEDPRSLGKALVGEYEGLWRYRIADYRLICIIKDDKLIVEAIFIGHRSTVYNKLNKLIK